MSDIPINLTGNLTPDEQYLWDATGTPTPATLAIESALSQLRYSGKPLAVTYARGPILRRWPLMALAAALLAAISLAIYFTSGPKSIRAYAGWQVAATTGKPSIGYAAVSKLPNAHVKTDAASTATLEYKSGSKVQITSSSEATLAFDGAVILKNGEASLEVPPTAPAAELIAPPVTCRLAPGCTATIKSIDGTSQVRVDTGWAEVSSGADKLRLDTAMACESQPKSASIWPPYRLTKGDNSAAIVKQLDGLIHQGKIDEKKQYMILQEALKDTRPEDAALLWNLLPRVQEWQREAIRNRLAKLVKQPPKGPAFDAVIKLDKDAMDAWWNAIIAK
jgi:hypothetical protein